MGDGHVGYGPLQVYSGKSCGMDEIGRRRRPTTETEEEGEAERSKTKKPKELKIGSCERKSRGVGEERQV